MDDGCGQTLRHLLPAAGRHHQRRRHVAVRQHVEEMVRREEAAEPERVEDGRSEAVADALHRIADVARDRVVGGRGKGRAWWQQPSDPHLVVDLTRQAYKGVVFDRGTTNEVLRADPCCQSPVPVGRLLKEPPSERCSGGSGTALDHEIQHGLEPVPRPIRGCLHLRRLGRRLHDFVDRALERGCTLEQGIDVMPRVSQRRRTHAGSIIETCSER